MKNIKVLTVCLLFVAAFFIMLGSSCRPQDSQTAQYSNHGSPVLGDTTGVNANAIQKK